MSSFHSIYMHHNVAQLIFIIGLTYGGTASADSYDGIISDAHTHVRSGVKFKKVIKSMDKANVDIAVIMSHDEAVTDEDVLDFYSEYPDRIIPAISFQHSRWRNQDADYMDYVNNLAAEGKYHWLGEASIRGKIDGNLNMPPDHQMLHQLFEASIKHKLPVAIHHNSSDKQEVETFIKTLEQHPGATVIWAHWCGLGTVDRARALLDKLPNLYCDLAWLHKHQDDLLTQLVDDDNQFLPEWKKLIEEKPQRFMVGIDASKKGHYGKKKKYRKWVKKVRTALGGLEPEAAEMVATKNLHRLLEQPTLLNATPVQAEGGLGPVPAANKVKGKELPMADVPFDMQELKKNWRSRIAAIKASGKLPIIDIESNYNPKKLNPNLYAEWMDEYGVALIAFAPSANKKAYRKKGKVWTDNMRKLIAIDPWRYIPVAAAPSDPVWPESPEEFLSETFEHVESDGYPLMAEFEFRHYMSGKQYKKGATHRDLDIPIDGEMGERLFAFSEESGVPFQIHQDIEDKTLVPLEKMLKKYPKAKVIWCHFTQMRFQDRNTVYGPGYIRKLIENHPNLYFDMAFGLADHIYPGSGEYDARIWDQDTGKIKPEWKKIIEDYPWRFLAAFDIGGNRMGRLPKKVTKMRRILEELPEAIREIIAYKAAWKLLFNEDI